MAKIDLKGVKKVASDGKSSTFKTKHGHSITVAHNGLSKEMLKELQALPLHKAEGGDDDSDLTEENEQRFEHEDDQPSPSPSPEPKKFAEGEEVTPRIDKTIQQIREGSNPVKDPTEGLSPTIDPSDPGNQEAETSSAAPVPDSAPVESAPIDSGSAPASETAPPAQPPTVDEIKQQKNQEDAAWAQDLVNQHVTPQTYQSLFAKKDTLGKIGTIFGMLISGAGAGLSHQPSALLKMMDDQINRDLDAQKQSKANAQNYLRLTQAKNLQEAQIGQIGAATEGLNLANAKTKMLLAAYHHIGGAVDNMPSGPLKQQALQSHAAVGQAVGQQVNQINDQAAKEQAFAQENQSLTALGAPELAKMRQETHLPGIKGIATTPISDKDRGEFAMKQNLQQKTQELRQWAQEHSGSVNPKTIAEGETKAKLLQDLYRQANGEGVFRGGEQSFVSSIIDSEPTKFFNSFRVDPKFKALENSTNQDINTIKQKYGFSTEPPQSKQAPQSKASAPAKTKSASQASKSKSGKEIIWKDGKPYYK